MRALFVHGMGRSRLSGWPLLRRLRSAGIGTYTFGYISIAADFAAIRDRLVVRITRIAQDDDYILIGHSLGGVLLRAAIQRLPPATRSARHLFLLGSPVTATRLASAFGGNAMYRALTHDCGRLLGSAARMSAIGSVSIPTTSIAGTRGFAWTRQIFDGASNDGVVAVSEVHASWMNECIDVHTLHTFLPVSDRVARIILQRALREPAGNDAGAAE